MTCPTPEDIKCLVEYATEPIIFRNILQWNILNWNLDDWKMYLENLPLRYRRGKYCHTQEPQWEMTTPSSINTFEEFISIVNENPLEWLYCDYVYLQDWSHVKGVIEDITWKDFGYPENDYKQSTIWIGSKGAHTPCHVDTYGCNLIAQVYGRKKWLIFPPEENLLPTRVPYEESSIFSKINFFSPSDEQIKGIGNGRLLTLNPGEVLFLPFGWWHYVENLETAISINTWLPHPADDAKRLEESIAQLLMTQLLKDLSLEQANSLLTPHSIKYNLQKNPLSSATELVFDYMEKSKHRVDAKKFKTNRKEGEKSVNDEGTLLKKYSEFITVVPKLSQKDLTNFLEEQKKEGQYSPDNSDLVTSETKYLIDAVLQPDVVKLIRDKLCNSCCK